jgi:membrane protein implicated in regulation of membrane protease activity
MDNNKLSPEQDKKARFGWALIAISAALIIWLLLTDFSVKTILGIAVAAGLFAFFLRKQSRKEDNSKKDSENNSKGNQNYIL